MSNNVFVDSTCLFSQRSLLDSISDPREDIVSFLSPAFDYAWSNQQLAEFSILATAHNPALAPKDPEDHYMLRSPVAQVLLKEKELLLESVEKLQECGLLKVLSFDDLLNKTDGSHSPFYEDSIVKQVHDLKMKVLTTSKSVQEELKLVHADIDIVAYAIANGEAYHSENPKIEDGTMASIMGVNSQLVGHLPFDGIEHVTPREIEAFLGDRSGFLEKAGEKVHTGYKKIFVTSVNVLSNLDPISSYGMAAVNTIKDVREIAKDWEHYDKISVIETRTKMVPQGPIKSLVDGFSAYRMNPIKHERDL
jgi:hypothetical protein